MAKDSTARVLPEFEPPVAPRKNQFGGGDLPPPVRSSVPVGANAWLAVVMFLGAEAMFFAGLIGAYLVFRVGAAINAVFGFAVAWVLVRYRFPGKSLLNAIVDLPLAIPTLVTGVMLVVLYGPQSFIGAWLENQFNWRIIFAPPGIILALLFVNFPFVVRAVQPVLQNLDRESEEAAATLGAGAAMIFWRVTLPALWLPIASGALLSFARAIGEFGAIVIVAGNIPLRSQTAAVYVFGEVESANRQGASAMSIVMLSLAFTLVLFVDWLRKRGRKDAEE